MVPMASAALGAALLLRGLVLFRVAVLLWESPRHQQPSAHAAVRVLATLPGLAVKRALEALRVLAALPSIRALPVLASVSVLAENVMGFPLQLRAPSIQSPLPSAVPADSAARTASLALWAALLLRGMVLYREAVLLWESPRHQ
jgi:hypothetical protein